MVQRRKILAALTRARLAELAAQLGLAGLSGKSKDALVQAVAGARTVKTAQLLDALSRDELKALCRALGLDDGGRDKQSLVARLTGSVGGQAGTRREATDRGRAGKDQAPVPASGGARGEAASTRGDVPAASSSRGKRGNPSMAKKSSDDKRPIEQYEHAGKTRANNPPVGLVTPATDPDLPRKHYQYDPHLDPQLVWAGKAEHTSFEVPTVSLHVHERIDPRTIIRAVQKRNGDPGGPRQQSLFEEAGENPPLREAIEFYKHAHGWTNRLIAGDSLVVMNSLLEKEGMAGKVQMVYIDPPYGIKYGSNFQPFVNQRDVRDGKDEDLTQEPEMIQAFRDIWELGIHSYLTNLRDRLLLARKLLHESGSCFVQISDENVHRVRAVMDEVFDDCNFCSLIAFKKTGALDTKRLSTVADYILWYARDVSLLKYRQLYLEKAATLGRSNAFRYFFDEDGNRRSVALNEDGESQGAPPGARLFQSVSLTSQEYSPVTSVPYEYEGGTYSPPANRHWTTGKEGLDRLARANRIIVVGDNLRYVSFLDDYPVAPLANVWVDTGAGSFLEPQVYVVQTVTKAIQRCMLMTTDPGDLVFDPTCGSGTTAFVAEQWGRRWITCDTSRVAITLAKQRLVTRLFDYYQLARPDEGVGSGFVYKTVPHVTLKSIANNPEIREGMTRTEIDAAVAKYAEQETLYDQPQIDRSRARVTGPFTVEAVPAPAVRPVTEVVIESQPVEMEPQPTLPGIGLLEAQAKLQFTEDVSVARFGETLRQRQWRDELLACGIRGKAGQRIEFTRLEPLGGTRWLQCEGETKPSAEPGPQPRPHPNPLPEGEGTRRGPHPRAPTATMLRTVPGSLPEGEGTVHRVVVSFGSEHAPLEQRQVSLALDEAQQLRPAPTMVIFATFQFDPEAAKDIDETKWPGVTLLKVQMNTDLLTDDLKKARSSNESYWLMGQPDVELRRVSGTGHHARMVGVPLGSGTRRVASTEDGTRSVPTTKDGTRSVPDTLYEVEVHGFDYYNPRTGAIESGDTTKIAMWMLDSDYDGRSVYPRQVFFPMAGPKDGWARLAKNLKAEIDEDLIEAYRGTVSLPFAAGDYRRAAVKIVDDRGIESLKVIAIE